MEMRGSRRSTLRWWLAGGLLLALLLPASAAAQAARVTGAVTDATGAVLPGVTVTLRAEPAGAVQTTVTDANGRYAFDNVAPGPYEISYDLPGFVRQLDRVTVPAGQTLTLEAKLQIGGQAEEVEVTGSLIPRPTLEAMSPVTTLDVEEITYRGVTRIEDLLQSLPQFFAAQNSTIANGASGTATVDLRYLGSDRTLVLIDGRRMSSGDAFATAPDLNFIPSALVKRVDILTGGASSVYGADAVAGVVNFVLDKQFVGVRGGFQIAGYQHNNNSDIAREINAARGFNVIEGSQWNRAPSSFNVAIGGLFGERKGHASAYLDYRDIPAITKDQRDYTNCSVQALGANGPACGGSGTWQNGRFLVLRPNGTTAGDYVLDVTSASGDQFRRRTSTDVFNFAPYNFMQRPDTRWIAGGAVNYEWNKAAEGYIDVMFMDDYTDAQIAPSGNFGNTGLINCNNPMLSAQQRQLLCTDAGYGPNDLAEVYIYRRNVEGGGRISQLRHTAFRFSGGVKGEINRTWSYDAYGLLAQVNSPQSYANDLNSERLQDALIVDGDPANPATWRCRSGNAGCVPWNIFRVGGVTQDALDYLALPLLLDSGTKTQLVNATLTADLKDYGIGLPSATEGFRVAFGGGYRKESLFVRPDLAYQTGIGAGQGGPTLPVEGDYDLWEFFAEGLVPLVQEARGAKDLSLELGYRWSDYSSTGGWPTYKVQASWMPTSDLKFRAGFNRATRSPNVTELYTPSGLGLGGSEDPCAGPNPTATPAQCALTGVSAAQYGNVLENPAGQYNTFEGGNPDLKPEVADTVTGGVVVTPSSMPGFTVAVDYFNIKVDDTVGSLGADDVITQCIATGNPTLCNLIRRDRLGTLWAVPPPNAGYTLTTNQNIGKFEAQGLDLNATYARALGGAGTFTTNLIGSYLMNLKTNTGLIAYDCAGYYGNQCGVPTPVWRHLVRFSWDTNFNTTLTLGWRFIGSVKNDDLSPEESLANPGNVRTLELNLADKLDAYNYFDLAANYRLAKNYQIIGGINNLFDKAPPLGSGSQANDYGAGFYGTYDSLGRYLFLGVQFTF